ncbi:MAG: site-specific DNA-methyltransferase [Halomonas sp.]|uniref:site-specific DNA-methyltransferase n=1 Tax=Halomonas sp. TaxID=1486246 RepID=UPI0017A4463D|nr:site-specific DNA-methyltransferase [Halomonas sp.]NWN82200.1 site-specific DNA-methyltransferase [Halomonas sp.]
MAKKTSTKRIETLTHHDATRTNIPTAEYQSVMHHEDQTPIQVAYARRNCDLDPQLVWRGKDEQNEHDLTINAPPLYIQEKVHPKALIDDLRRQSERNNKNAMDQTDLFGDFNGLPEGADKTEFYRHEGKWQNRMILGDSLQVMASLTEREGLRGKVQCIYFDPPYGIKFNSNFQWSTTSRDVRDGKAEHITREPEQVKAFRDTWRDGIHSYLTYLRDRLIVARDLLTESGSIFVQIGDENVHRVRAVLDEIFGEDNFVAQITFRVKSPLQVSDLARTTDFLLWYAHDKNTLKFRQPRTLKTLEGHPEFSSALLPDGNLTSRTQAAFEPKAKYFTAQNLASSGYTQSCMYDVEINGRTFKYPKGKSWKTHKQGMERLRMAARLQPLKTSLRWRYFFDDAPSEAITDIWQDTFAASEKTYVVQTSEAVVQRCILMATDPGDLVLDPTCGSGTAATVAEQWGRRWITLDTSRVALALARARIMGARYPYYLLADSPEGQQKEAEISRSAPSSHPTSGNIAHGFVYQRVPHITLKSIANNAEIDVIWERFQETLEPLRERLNEAVAASWEEWEIPREAGEEWPDEAKQLHAQWWEQRIARQREIDASIAAKADQEYLYDKPYEDKKKVRVAGPFTVESLTPHRVLGVDENDELIDGVRQHQGDYEPGREFNQIILENLKTAGVQQAHKEDRIVFSSLTPWPGEMICAEGRYAEGQEQEDATVGDMKRAAILIGPEFGTVSRPDLVQAAREAADAGFDVLIACAFNFDAHSAEFEKLGRLPVLKARMNADLHMASDLKNTGKGNLFVIFGEPDIDILDAADTGDGGVGQIQVKVNGVDVFHPNTGEVRSDGPEGIACWFIDTDYDEEGFFVRHAYFLGAGDPYKALKTTLKAEIDEDAWSTLNSDTSRPFDKPNSGRIAVKVINHLGDEVMKVFRV